MLIKIHINHNKQLYLCNAIDAHLQELLHHPETVFIDELNTNSVKAMLKELTLPEITTGIFFNKDINALQKAVFKKFEIIKAGGGLIINEKQDILLIFRRGFWDLPKGKLDKGETIEDCAVREVQEETGLHDVVLGRPLTTTYHTYHHKARRIIKESHWFIMTATSDQILVPQIDEDIEKICWVAPKDLPNYLSKAYPSIVDVLQEGVPGI